MIIAVTGHRPNKLGGYRIPNPYYNSIMTELDRALLELQPERVIVGMAQGVDQWMAKLCLFNGIPFVAAIPFLGFEIGGNWPQNSVEEYQRLLARACEVVPVGRPPYSAWKMQRRNEWMVDNSDLLLAVFDGTIGGTSNCVNYAMSVRKTVRRINYLRPPPVVNREERQPLTVSTAPFDSPPPEVRREQSQRRRLSAEQVVAQLLGPNPPETEGQRAARRRAQAEREREERAQRRIAEASEQARVRRAEGPRLQITDVPAEPSEPPQEEKGPDLIRDFGRFVDLDV